MIEHAFRWAGETGIGLLMRQSTWGFAIVETIHLLGLALLGGAVLAINLSAGHVRFRRVDPSVIAKAAWPILLGALATMIVSGALLVSSKPVRYYLDDMFRAKMALLALSIASSLLLNRLLARHERAPLSLRLVASLSLALWLGVGVAGRLIGFL